MSKEKPAAEAALASAPKINRHLVMVESCGLRDGAPIMAYSDFDSIVLDIESVLNKDGSKPNAKEVIRDFVNSIIWQKGPLVDFRDQFTTDLELATGFVYPLKTVVTKKKDGTESSRQVPAITEKDYLQSFRKAIAEKTLTSLSPSPELGKVKEGDVFVVKNQKLVDVLNSLVSETKLFAGGGELEDWLQRLANARSDQYICDAKQVEREPKERKLPDYAISDAKAYLGLTEYKNSKGVVCPPLSKEKQRKLFTQIIEPEFAKWNVSCPTSSFTGPDMEANVLTLARGLQAMKIAKDRVAPPVFLGEL